MGKNLILGLVATAIVVSALLAGQNVEQRDEFTEWKVQYGKTFGSSEDAYRKVVFMNNMKMIAEHNANPSHSYKLGKGPFTAFTQAEFELMYLRPKAFNPEWLKADLTVPELTEDVDWTAKGIISPVKVMGQCPAGWAFTAVAELETLALSKNQTVYLSEQQLVDCSLAYGNLACDDGDAYAALGYVKDHGLQTEDEYPYIERKEKCKHIGGNFKIASWHFVKGCAALATNILQRPLGVSVDATNWPHYRSGIFTNCDDQMNINLDVYLVGATSTFWKIKNAWGTAWGEDGFIRIGHRTTCGMCVDKCTWAI